MQCAHIFIIVVILLVLVFVSHYNTTTLTWRLPVWAGTPPSTAMTVTWCLSRSSRFRWRASTRRTSIDPSSFSSTWPHTSSVQRSTALMIYRYQQQQQQQQQYGRSCCVEAGASTSTEDYAQSVLLFFRGGGFLRLQGQYLVDDRIIFFRSSRCLFLIFWCHKLDLSKLSLMVRRSGVGST